MKAQASIVFFLLYSWTLLPCQQKSTIIPSLISETTRSFFSALSKFHPAIYIVASVTPIVRGVITLKHRNRKLRYDFWTLETLKELDSDIMVLYENQAQEDEQETCVEQEIVVDFKKWARVIEASAHDVQLALEPLNKIQFQINANISSLAAASNYYIKVHPQFFVQTEEEQQFIMAHELIHLTEHHGTLKAIALMAIPLMQYTLWHAIEMYCLHHLFTQEVSIPFKIAQNLLLRNGITQGALTYYCIKQFSNYLEKRADLGACSSSNQCLTAVLHFRHTNEPPISRFSWRLDDCCHSHPTHKQRVTYLIKRYKKLCNS